MIGINNKDRNKSQHIYLAKIFDRLSFFKKEAIIQFDDHKN